MTSSSDKMYRRALKYAKAYHLAAFGVAYATNRRNAYRRLRAADRVCRILRGEPAFASWVGDSSAAAAVKTRVWYEVRRTNIKTGEVVYRNRGNSWDRIRGEKYCRNDAVVWMRHERACSDHTGAKMRFVVVKVTRRRVSK